MKAIYLGLRQQIEATPSPVVVGYSLFWGFCLGVILFA